MQTTSKSTRQHVIQKPNQQQNIKDNIKKAQRQGTGNGGTTRTFTSVPMMKIVDQIAPGCTIELPKGKEIWIIKMMAFVDDKRHYTNSLKQQLIKSVIKAMEKSVSKWYELLLFVGDDLELSKCGWYGIDWGLDSNDKPKMNKTKHKLWIITPTGEKIPLKQLNPNTTSTYLGVTSQIDGDQTAQLSKLIKSVKELSKKLSTCHMPHATSI